MRLFDSLGVLAVAGGVLAAWFLDSEPQQFKRELADDNTAAVLTEWSMAEWRRGIEDHPSTS